MSNKIIPILALVLAAGVPCSDALAADAAAAPLLHVIQMTGEIRVTTPGLPADDSSRNRLPNILPGSEVHVLNGTALFQTDSQVTVAVAAGDAFLFTAEPAGEAVPPSIRISALGADTSLHLDFDGKRFLLRDYGAVEIGYGSEGETPVRVLGGMVALLPGTVLTAGESITVSTTARVGGGMSPDDSLVAWVPKERGFDHLPVDFSSLIITREDDSTFVASTGRAAASGETARAGTAERAIASWPVVSRLTAGFLIEKYGAPGEVGSDELSWSGNAPWKKTVVRKAGALRAAPRSIVEQSVGYDVPRSKLAALAQMGMGLTADRRRKELSAVSESEEANFLAVNLANDVITGRMAVKDAKLAYERTLALAAAGKSSPYTEALAFEPLATDAK